MTPYQIEKINAVPGWLSNHDITALCSLAETIENGTIVELGSMHGKSANVLAAASPTSKIFCMDYWSGHVGKTEDGIDRPNSIEIFKSFTAGCPNVYPVQLSLDTTTVRNWEDPVDMLFLDAAHTNPDDWECISFWLPKIKQGGILCGHDYYTESMSPIVQYPDVISNVRRLEEMLGKPVTLYGHSSVWSFRV